MKSYNRAIMKSIIFYYKYGSEYHVIIILYESNHFVNDCIIENYVQVMVKRLYSKRLLVRDRERVVDEGSERRKRWKSLEISHHKIDDEG